jgi:hypothetical protein
MKTRTLITLASLTVSGFSVAGVAWHSRQLDSLRNEGHRLQLHLDNLTQETSQSALASTPSAVSPPSEELLRLRNQVSQLTRRERELAGVQDENERLRTQVVAARTNTAPALPASFIRKSQARNLGYGTPEATTETFLWAVRNGDVETFLGCFAPVEATQIRHEIERAGSAANFFEKAGGLPGINLVEPTNRGNDLIEYRAELMPGSGNEAILFRRINGEWKMERK